MPVKRLLGSPLTAACVLGLAIVGAAAIHTTATPAPAPMPTAVAIVDISKLSKNLDESKARQALVEQHGQELQGKLSTMVEEIKRLQKEIDEVIPKTETKRRAVAIANRYEKEGTLKACKETYQTLYDTEVGDLMHEMYDKIVAATADVAKRDGYDLVVMDDRPVQLPQLGIFTADRVQAAIEAKRIVYARDGMDITDRVLTKMNNDYATSKSSPPSGDVPKATPVPAPTNPK